MQNNQENQSVEPAGVPEITKGKWELSDGNDIFVKNGDNLTIIAEMDDKYNPFWDVDALAICNAVNNTYGKGIDPEAVPELVEALKEAIKEIPNRIYGQGESYKNPTYTLIEEALKKAEIKK
jgi:hypothetical protein